MATQVIRPKTNKIKIYYYDSGVDENNNEIERRVFLHTKYSNGVWAAILDQKQDISNIQNGIDIKNIVIFIICKNKEVIDKYIDLEDNPMFVVFRDKIYKILTKPDEYDYNSNDIKLYCEMTTDTKVDNPLIYNIYQIQGI